MPLEVDLLIALEAQAGQVLDALALLTALHERHGGGEVGAFVDAVDGAIDVLYQQGRFSLPAMIWAPDDAKPSQSIRGWLSVHKDAIAWDSEVSAYVWKVPPTSYSRIVFISKSRKLASWRPDINVATIYTYALCFIIFSLVLWEWCRR